ncbi:SWIM zinc finger family protein [Cohnella massiliensis]|uniref:SWIM zinc finger family protein n=1 Tax=Cohnella massiliensis TaxID=1816691 RepID=UPI0009BA555B|nr:hypothetical protein [Cohnella massiliensis]
MNIRSFEQDIGETLLERGHDYYAEGRVVDVYEQGEREYVFRIQGSDDYMVVVKLDEQGEILSSSCDCPYDYSSVCKHEVAAYYELSDLLSGEDEARQSDGQSAPAKRPDLREALNCLSKEELVSIVLEQARKDEILRNTLMVNHAGGDARQELNKCRKLIDAIVRKYQGRGGFIPYRETAYFARELSGVLNVARNAANKPLALDIAFLLLENAVEAFQYADDSDGSIGGLADEALELIEEIAGGSGGLEPQARERMFDKLLQRSDSDVFEGWEDYRIGLLRIGTVFADAETLRIRLREKIENRIRQHAADEYNKYSTESMLGILLDMLEQYGTAEEAERFVKEQLRYSSFRERYIQKCLQEKNFHQALESALEGEAQDRSFPGLVVKWKQLRYIAYKGLSLKEEQERLARELLSAGHFEYYGELKLLTAGDETVYSRLKQELSQGSNWQQQGVYLRLLEEENDLDALMEYVRENPRSVERYASKLADRFKDEVAEAYRTFIRSAASAASNRKQYKDVCAVLTRFKKIAGSDVQQELASELKSRYNRKPAFVEELDNVM